MVSSGFGILFAKRANCWRQTDGFRSWLKSEAAIAATLRAKSSVFEKSTMINSEREVVENGRRGSDMRGDSVIYIRPWPRCGKTHVITILLVHEHKCATYFAVKMY